MRTAFISLAQIITFIVQRYSKRRVGVTTAAVDATSPLGTINGQRCEYGRSAEASNTE